MKFKFFSATGPETQLPTAMTRSAPDEYTPEAERVALSDALHALLADLPQSFKDKDHLKRMSEFILDATPRLRLVWLGFCSDEQLVAPYSAVGACVPEANDWRLPQACFEEAGPYSQASLESIGKEKKAPNSLFTPWHADMDACTANCALAIPLRSEKNDVRGLIVFYSDDLNYFSRLGIAPFQAFAHVVEIIWQQSSLVQMLAQKAQLDMLTGLMNRRKMTFLLQRAVERAEKENEALSIMILRIEDFSIINEVFGWNAADDLLVSFAKEITLQLRAQDRVGRWTGVEFLYILPRTDRHHAEFLGQGLQAYFATHPLSIQDKPIQLRLRMGIASHKKDMGVEGLLRQAGNHSIAPMNMVGLP